MKVKINNTVINNFFINPPSNIFNSYYKNIIRIILYIFWFILLLSNIYTILRKNKNIDDILFIMVLEIGLILSHLLVEVSPRYFIPATVPIMIIAAFNIYNTKWDKKIIINKK